MRQFINSIFIIFSLVIISHTVKAQFLKVLERQVENQLKNRASQRVGQAVDKGLNEVEDAAKGKDTNDRQKNKKQKESTVSNDDDNTGNGSVKANNKIISSDSKFDFVTGEKIISLQDFSQ